MLCRDLAWLADNSRAKTVSSANTTQAPTVMIKAVLLTFTPHPLSDWLPKCPVDASYFHLPPVALIGVQRASEADCK